MKLRHPSLTASLVAVSLGLGGCSILRNAVGGNGSSDGQSASNSASSNSASSNSASSNKSNAQGKDKPADMRQLVKSADAAREALFAALKATPGPVDPALWKTFDDAVAALAVHRPDAPSAYRHLAFNAYIREARTSSSPEERLPELFYGASLLSKHSVNAKESTLKIKVPADTCFVMLSNEHPGTTNSSITGVKVGKDFETIQRIKTDDFGAFEGACTRNETTLEYAIQTKGGGTKVGADWFVLGWRRAAFPVEIAAKVSVFDSDRCSAGWIYNAFTDGVPGLLVWTSNRKPALIMEALRSGQRVLRASSSRDSFAVTPDKLQAAWPTNPDLQWAEATEVCTKDPRSPDPLVAKAQACHEKVTKQYKDKLATTGAKRDAAKRALDTAKPAQWGAARRNYAAADKAFFDVVEAERKARVSECVPLDKKYQAAVDAMLPRLGDFFLAGPKGTPTVDVPAFLSKVAEVRSY